MTAIRDTGQVYVTQAAARQYAAAAVHGERLGDEESRRDLTIRLLDAKRIEGDTETPERWRRRSRADGIDITARVVTQDGLRVVLSVTARAY